MLHVESVQGYAPGDILYIGALGREGCEKVVIDAMPSATTITLTSSLALDHSQYEPVTSVLGDLIHIYRAADIDGSVPADEMFTVLATRNIDPDQPSSFYTDASGSSAFWYRSTYYNATTTLETSLKDSEPRRGDDFGHYARISEIRKEAGFESALNLKDNDVDQQRRAAESEINAALSLRYTVPFKPVPEIVHTLTVQLAAALLLVNAYGESGVYAKRLKDARDALRAYADGGTPIIGGDGQDTSTDQGVDYDFGDQPRMFSVGDKF